MLVPMVAFWVWRSLGGIRSNLLEEKELVHWIGHEFKIKVLGELLANRNIGLI